MLDTFFSSAFTLRGAPVSWAELIGFATGLAAVTLAAQERISNYPVGIVNSLFFCLLFFNARLFADAALQIVFLLLGAFGWWAWLRRRQGGGELEIRDASPWLVVAVIGGIALMTLALVPLLRGAHGSRPLFDALTTSMSVGAQLLLCLKLRQTWWFWIAVDVVSVPLFIDRGLYLTAIVYAVFLMICARAVVTWRAPVAAREPALVAA